VDRSDFYQEHLDRVSRSFAFCIARLDEPLREYVGLGYLICRLVDTVEDAPWKTFAEQSQSFADFDHLLSKVSREGCRKWADGISKEIPQGEKLLLDDAFEILNDFQKLPPAVYEALIHPIRSMSRGMRFYMERTALAGELRLRDQVDVNRYCFFVAGVVGEMLTQLLKTEIPELPKVDLVQAYRFGLFLQKVNLLKDQASDEPQGRFLIPSRPLVRANVMVDAREAFAYLLSIPHGAESFRLFCAWSLFLGLASLPWIDQADREKRTLKISRDETFVLLAKVEELILNDEKLRELFEDLYVKAFAQPCIPLTPEASTPEEPPYLALYEGALSPEQVVTIFRQ
jgi:phytoene/squalene synthetase